MAWTVVVEVGDHHVPASDYDDHPNVVGLRIDSEDASRRISHGGGRDTSWGLLDRLQIPGTPDAAADLLRFALAVYTTDCRLPREEADDAWARRIDLHLPVVEVDKWEEARDVLNALLRFLTGDVWTTHFYQGAEGRPAFNDRLRKRESPMEATAVCLLSGGLDSFIGAADALAGGEHLYLVSHNQGKYTAPPQSAVVAALGARFGKDNIRHFQAGVHPPPVSHFAPGAAPVGSETTTRSRSLLFFAYGALVAASMDGVQPLLIPENGFITINPPLVPSRAGSNSTRTTHPETVRLFRLVLDKLDLSVSLQLDYRFKTKGEMLLEAVEASWVRNNALLTISCGKPNAAAIKTNGNLHQCGACVPCIIRRAALHAGGVAGEKYANQHLTMHTSKDSRAFAIALERLEAKSESLLPQVMGTGPIDPDDLEQYLGVVRRGFSEVDDIL